VALPLAKPIVALVFFFSFVATGTTSSCRTRARDSSQVPDPGWSVEPAVIDPRRSTRPWAVAVSRWTSPAGLALATLLAVIPVAIVFLLSQRALVRGLVGGAVKE
jgi:multiple sugar transport system permease protein